MHIKKTILAVDDTPLNLDLYQRILSSDYKVLAALNGADALEIITDGIVPDLIFLDIFMPGLSGFEVCRELRSRPQSSNAPVIFASGQITDKERTAGIEAGGNGFICKPFTMKELRYLAGTLLNMEF